MYIDNNMKLDTSKTKVLCISLLKNQEVLKPLSVDNQHLETYSDKGLFSPKRQSFINFSTLY